MSLKLWTRTLLVLAVKPQHARLHRRLQALLDAGGMSEQRAVGDIERRLRRLRVMQSVRSSRAGPELANL